MVIFKLGPSSGIIQMLRQLSAEPHMMRRGRVPVEIELGSDVIHDAYIIFMRRLPDPFPYSFMVQVLLFRGRRQGI